MCPCKRRPHWAQTVTDVFVYELLMRLFHIGNFCFRVPFLKQLLLRNCAVDFVEICNVYVGKITIKAAKRIFNSDKICRSYNDLNFGVTFLEHSVYAPAAWMDKDQVLLLISADRYCLLWQCGNNVAVNFAETSLSLAACISYADLNNLCCACVVTFPPAFFAVTSYKCKVNAMVFVVLLQVHRVNFLNR